MNEDMTPNGTVNHDTGNYSTGADAKMHSSYLKSISPSFKNWHITIDSGFIIQHIPFNRNAWQSGDGDGEGNRKRISLEGCVNQDGDWQKTRENMIMMNQQLMLWYNWDIGKVGKHQDFSGKHCPRLILDEGWQLFLSEIEKEV